ncbi:hypothetical protein WR25_15196 [Diploscapter pachys]|uniref:Peptidase M16 C-terminal domain-containing protein n=1 Tax=Diploscapter pachys TaxID=2018661 RepID=A0A2A2K036_9BILA|nr:hypothetical protein WR25_15196 [Diploscapter pachys]
MFLTNETMDDLHKQLARPRSSVLLIRSSALRFSTSPAMEFNSNMIAKRFDSILKSQEDSREYRGLELSNELRVLLVSDPTTDKSAVAMDVNVEHMLFLGTAKYPEEDEYFKFIASNAGMSNAFTAPNHTNYHFDVKPDQLQGALDRFVQFFLTPQFTESATEREVCAVDSEHSNNLKNDERRNLQVDKHMSKPGHDYGKFGTGNKKTLMEDARTKGIEPREALLEFHKQWYSSNIMCLCIVGKESLDELENLVTSLNFGTIENKSVERKQWLDHPYQGESLGKRIEVVPVKDTRSLKLVFPMPDLIMEYKSQPARYLSHLIGHEAKGSLPSELKRRGWVSSLSSGHHSPAKGLEHTEEIVALIFAYIGMLRKVGVQRWIHDELQLKSTIQFRFQDKQTPLNLAQTAAEELQYIPMNDILSSRYLIEEFKPDRITELLNMLTPQNFYYRVVAQKFAGQAVTKISITTPMVAHDPKNTLLSNLWILCFTDNLAEDTYNAKLAGLRQSISMNRFGTFIKEAHNLAADVASILKSANKNTVRPLFRNEFQPARDVALSNGDEFIYRHYQNTHNVGCVDMIYQFGIQNIHENTLAKFMVQLMKQTAFNTLRTNEQLGYIVWTISHMQNGTLGLDLIVQGSKDPDHVLSRIENFIETFQARLKSMSEAEFNEHKEALICCLLEKPKTLNTRNDRIWNEIDCQQYDFERNEDEAAFLKTITKDQVLDYYSQKLVKGAQERRVVACLEHPKGSDEAMTRRKREAKEENCHSRQIFK